MILCCNIKCCYLNLKATYYSQRGRPLFLSIYISISRKTNIECTRSQRQRARRFFVPSFFLHFLFSSISSFFSLHSQEVSMNIREHTAQTSTLTTDIYISAFWVFTFDEKYAKGFHIKWLRDQISQIQFSNW